jgi:hypothetical protein
MAQNFPNSPSTGTSYTVNSETWTYNGTGWIRATSITTLPGQSGNSGKYLTTNGTTISWATVSGGGGSSVSISDSQPSSPQTGNIWFNSSNLNTYVYYNDGDSNQWVRIGTTNDVNALPTQTGNSGKYLTTNGTALSWTTSTGVQGTTGSGTQGTTGSQGTIGIQGITGTQGTAGSQGVTGTGTQGTTGTGSQGTTGSTGSQGTSGSAGGGSNAKTLIFAMVFGGG